LDCAVVPLPVANIVLFDIRQRRHPDAFAMGSFRVIAAGV